MTMVNPFFTALEQQGFDEASLLSQTKSVLLPFKHYLDNSIKALEKKEVSCEWIPLDNRRYQLKFNKRIWQLLPVSEIEMVGKDEGWYEILRVDGERPDADFDPDESDPILQGKGRGRRETKLAEGGYDESKYHLLLPNFTLDDEAVSWSGYQLEIRPLSVHLDDLESIHIDGQECKVRDVHDSKIILEGYVKASSMLSIHGRNMPFRLLKGMDESLLKQWDIKADGNGWLLFSASRPQLDGHLLEDVTNERLAELACEHFELNDQPLETDDWNLTVEGSKGGGSKYLILESQSNKRLDGSEKLKCSRFPKLVWTVKPTTVEEKWIQLIEKEGSDDTGKSDLDYFFGDNPYIKILDASQHKFDDGYRILKARPEERQILLARNSRSKKRWDSEYPSSKIREIRVSVDTSQLKRQKHAINQLMNRPSSGHWPLIQMLQNRESTSWPDVMPVPKDSISWRILTNPTFDGCDRQREFVCKAMANKDFTILDGPPGTGKTTTILELIMQLVLQGKKVLLSASTHAAINNVLERIKDHPELSSHIFPLRIGDENNARGVEKFQFDKMLENLRKESGIRDLSKQLMVDASNLVCGTTIGILRLFNDRELSLDISEPPFDVMIIDECSKTTFQEFLVPARFARRWVLVGDIRQLSPFTDREQIVTNLDQNTCPKSS